MPEIVARLNVEDDTSLDRYIANRVLAAEPGDVFARLAIECGQPFKSQSDVRPLRSPLGFEPGHREGLAVPRIIGRRPADPVDDPQAQRVLRMEIVEDFGVPFERLFVILLDAAATAITVGEINLYEDDHRPHIN